MISNDLFNIGYLNEGDIIKLYKSDNIKMASEVVLRMSGTKATTLKLKEDNTVEYGIMDCVVDDSDYCGIMNKSQLLKLINSLKEMYNQL